MAFSNPVQICWLFAREGKQSKLGPENCRTISQDLRYSSKLKRQLMLGEVLPSEALPLQSDPGHRWHAAFSKWDGQVVGAAVFRTNSKFDVMSSLSAGQRCVREYWAITKFAEAPLVLLDVAAVCALATPVSVRSVHTTLAPTAMFFQCTPFSLEELLSQSLDSGGALMDVVHQWHRQFCGSLDAESQTLEEIFRALKCHQTCFCMPAPHALLISKKAWTSYSFPLTEGRAAAGMGLRFVRDLWKPLQDGSLAPLASVQSQRPGPSNANSLHGAEALLQPDTLQAVADFIRKAARELPHLSDEASQHVALLQDTVDSLVQDAQATSRRAFALETLIHSLIVSGYLHNSAEMRDLLRAALRVCVRVPQLLEHFDNMLCKPRRVPGASTLYRHRLTVHVAFCRWVSHMNNPIVLDESGFCRWGTLDSSPQGSWDWLLAGATLARMSSIESCFEDSNKLICLGKRHNAAEQTQLAQRLASHLTIVQGTPTAVGTGRSDLVHKVHALCHSVRLSAANWLQTCELLNGTITWTADLGVESGLNTFRGNACAMFGDWVLGEIDGNLLSDPAEVAGAGVAEAQGSEGFDFTSVGRDSSAPNPDLYAAMRAYNLDFTQSIYIPGPLHIMHNLTEGLGTAMSWWSELILRLTHLCRLLGRKWNRQRLFATCFSDPPWNAFVHLYGSFDGQVYKGRWGTVVHAVKELLPLERSLRGAWCKAKFCLNGQPPREGRDGTASKSLNVDLVDEACQSQQFWAYARMVSELGETIEHVMHWCESCPCHGHDEELQGKAKHSKTGLFARIGLCSCPLASRRAPECAAGAILKVIEQGLQSLQRTVMLQDSFLACGEDARQVVLSDCNHAKRYCVLVARMKFSHWEQLPWVLMGLGHHEADAARRCGARALQLYAAMGDQVTQHPVAHLLCCPGTQGHAQLTSFVGGEALDALPLLRRVAAKYKFVAVSERWVESRHALIKRNLRKATHVSAQHVAFSGCQHMLRELLLHRTHGFSQLVALCGFTRSPGHALQAVNLHFHPSVRGILRVDRSQLARKYRPWVVELLYHADRETLYQGLPQDGGYIADDGGDAPGGSGPTGLKDAPSLCGSAEAPAEDGGSVQGGHRGPPPPATGGLTPDSKGGILHDSLWCKYAVEHLRQFLDQKQQPDCHHVFSLGPRLQTDLQHALTDLAQHVNPTPEECKVLPALESFDFLECRAPAEDSADSAEWANCHGVLLSQLPREVQAT